jgi:hypothetical protein
LATGDFREATGYERKINLEIPENETQPVFGFGLDRAVSPAALTLTGSRLCSWLFPARGRSPSSINNRAVMVVRNYPGTEWLLFFAPQEP